MNTPKSATDRAFSQWSRHAKLSPSALAQLLKAEIAAGKYALGALLPTEQTLQAEFDVSRYCVREALQLLKDCGMVSARAGIGHTVLSATPMDGRYMHGSSTLEELIQSADTTLQVLKSRSITVDASLEQEVGFPLGERVVQVTALRNKVDYDSPIALLTLTLREAHHLMVKFMEGQKEGFHIMLERRYGVTIHEVRQSIIAMKIDAQSARLLRSSPHQPCLRITRKFLDASAKVIFTSVGLYPSDRFSHDTAIQIFR